MSSSESAGREFAGLAREVAVPSLVEKEGGRLYGLCRRICASPEEAEDLVQEVFLQAWRRWEQFRGDSKPLVWLYTIARHACQRMHRKRAGEPAKLESLDELLPFGAPRLAVLPSDVDEFDEHVRREQGEIAGEAIASLPIEFRMPLVLKEIVGFSIAETAQILGLPENTVKTRVHRGRLKVRKALESGLPERELPPPAYDRQVCMDLLTAKMEALDRGVEMPNANEIICERCRAVFATLDLASDVCASMASGDVLPEQTIQAIRDGFREAS